MTPQEFNLLVIQACKRIQQSQPHEDSLIEFKANWPTEFPRTARQLAAHANAAHGQQIIWIIGADRDRGVIGAPDIDVANWLPQIQKYFENKFSPRLLDHRNFPVEGSTVGALLFETDLAPFVVVNDAQNDRSEVPYRAGTNTRSATRTELLQMLVPITKAPEIEICSALFQLIKLNNQFHWLGWADLFVSLRTPGIITLPRHRVVLRLIGAPHSTIEVRHPMLMRSANGNTILALTSNESNTEAVFQHSRTIRVGMRKEADSLAAPDDLQVQIEARFESDGPQLTANCMIKRFSPTEWIFVA